MGIPRTRQNSATFSRLSHVNMAIDTAWEPGMQEERDVQNTMTDNALIFAYLLDTEYDKVEVEKLANMLNTNDVIRRSIHIAASDWYWCRVLIKKGFDMDVTEIDRYFKHTYVELLQKYCCRLSVVETMCQHIRRLRETDKIPPRECAST